MAARVWWSSVLLVCVSCSTSASPKNTSDPEGRCPEYTGDAVDFAGARLAYSTDVGGQYKLYVAASPDNASLLSGFAGGGLTEWSPDRTRLAFSTLQGDIFVQAATPNAAAERIAVGGFQRWSPDGSQLAFHRDGDVFTICADGSKEVNLTQSPRFIDGMLSIVWSPNGRQILYNSNREGDAQVFVIDAEGGPQQNLSRSDFIDNDPVWSPDGTRILYTTTRDGGGLAVMNADGSDPHLIVADRLAGTASWSPDGHHIVFATSRDGNIEIYTASADGDDQRNLTNTVTDEWFHPEWSPDGSQIAFASSGEGGGDIWVMDADGANLERWTSSSDREFGPTWIS